MLGIRAGLVQSFRLVRIIISIYVHEETKKGRQLCDKLLLVHGYYIVKNK